MLPMTKNGSTVAALELTIRDLTKRFGDGCIWQPGATGLAIDSIPTGYPPLDAALGVGGLPRGRITDIYGPESSGKTTLCLSTIAQAQAQAHGGSAAFIDTEHALDLTWCTRLGVDLDRLYVAQPDTGEEALEIAEAMVRAGLDVVAIDSAASLVPRVEIEAEMGDNHAGLQSRLMAQALRKLVGLVRQHHAALLFTNQLRYNPHAPSPNSEIPTGGMALRFHASVRIDLRRIRAIKSNGTVIGTRVRATITKNKVAPPYKSAEFEIIF